METSQIRKRMPAFGVAKVKRTLHAKHHIGTLEVATGLTAANKAAVIFTTEVRGSGDRRVLRYPERIHSAPAAAGIGAKIAAGPVVQRCGHRASLNRHICG